jgi:hypothetical protein
VGNVDTLEQFRRVFPIDEAAHPDIRVVEFTLSPDGDSPVLPDLLEQISVDENISATTHLKPAHAIGKEIAMLMMMVENIKRCTAKRKNSARD